MVRVTRPSAKRCRSRFTGHIVQDLVPRLVSRVEDLGLRIGKVRFVVLSLDLGCSGSGSGFTGHSTELLNPKGM